MSQEIINQCISKLNYFVNAMENGKFFNLSFKRFGKCQVIGVTRNLKCITLIPMSEFYILEYPSNNQSPVINMNNKLEILPTKFNRFTLFKSSTKEELWEKSIAKYNADMDLIHEMDNQIIAAYDFKNGKYYTCNV